MAKRSLSQHFKGFSLVQGDVKVKVNLARFEKQYQKAQYALDTAVMVSMEPFMPKQRETFINLTKGISASMAGSGIVCAAAPPMGRFLYEGKNMVDELTGSPWARKDAKKVLVSQYGGITNAREDLIYSNAKARDHWFDVAKQKDCKSWVKLAKRIAGGG